MRRDALLLAEMIDAAERLIELTVGREASEFEDDRGAREALLWNYTVLGEASPQVSPELKGDHPEVPWSDPVRLRNRIVHGYWSADLDVLTSTATDDVPGLLKSLRTIAEKI